MPVPSVRSCPKLSNSARNAPNPPAKIIKKMLNRLCFPFHLLAKTALQVKSGKIPIPEPSKIPVFPCFNYSLNRCFTNSCFAVVRYPYQIVQISPFPPDCRQPGTDSRRQSDHPFPFSIIRRPPFRSPPFPSRTCHPPVPFVRPVHVPFVPVLPVCLDPIPFPFLPVPSLSRRFA